MRTVFIDLVEILDLAACGEGSGLDSMVMADLAAWAGPVTDAEINEYCDEIMPRGAYGEEDLKGIRERLTEWRDKYSHKK